MSALITKNTPSLFRSLAAPTAWNTVGRRMISQNKEIIQTSQNSIANVDILTGAPEELVTERVARIFRPAKTATQSGKNGSRTWRVEFDILEDGNRWENPLMGWASSSDYMQSLAMKFPTKEAAIKFAEKEGWRYEVVEPKVAKFVKKSYADNYKFSAGKLRMIKTK
ncbi:ETC complex I subunit conserved region-domain-containing protein [Phycomyces blakesleeanus]|uniref:NADH dehydrogenase [ubiquinone] iron-sulfur protein 4, mitochondrial n=2 Tax=Phycomyces blakesleeanus TaxID=4837 RepID=A0ABR3AMC3_PHYBL